MPIPPLITTEGLVLNNMMPGEGALGGYTPPGTASSEGISLMLRGIVRAAIATQDPAKTTFAKFLFDAACKYFFRDIRPSATAGQGWHHSWIVNGGMPFSVRGPLQPSGDLALSGYLYGRDPESEITFTAGVGQLVPPPDISYQAVSNNAEFVWDNMFSDLLTGTRLNVSYYIDAKGNKVFGTQKGGSFGQPSIPAGDHQDGGPGKIVLTEVLTGVYGVNYCVTVPDVKVAYGELYEAWPMWRKLAENEVTTAADAIHWFLDAFELGMQLEPTNLDWKNGRDRMLEVWEQTCTQESNNTFIFRSGSSGPYNNGPLTYGYGYGRNNIDDPSSNWDAVPPTNKFTATRESDGFITFTAPEESAVKGSGGSIRYGIGFENSPLYLTYTGESGISANVKSSELQTLTLSISGVDEIVYDATVLAGPSSVTQTVGIAQFMKFQQEPGDASGDKTGDWPDAPVDPELPHITPVPFPGYRVCMIGDSITAYNNGYYPPNPSSNRFMYYSQSMAGYFTYANALMGQRLIFEPGIAPDITGRHMGLNFGVASSRVVDWWLEDFAPNTVPEKGPMWAALNSLNNFDIAYLMGGTNDLSGNLKAEDTAKLIIRAAAEIAAQGKWVFVGAIPPRSRELLAGYTLEQQDIIRARLVQVNALVKAAVDDLDNMWFVDYYNDLLGPNGIDPTGSLSSNVNPDAPDTDGNYNPLYTNIKALHDGLHPACLGAYLMGKKFAQVTVAAGVPARTITGTNITPNPSFTFTQYDLPPSTPSMNWSYVGWATGLGSQLTVAGAIPKHNGYVQGKMPDNIHFYRGTNQADQLIGQSVGGTYSNFMEYTWAAFSGLYPEIQPFCVDSTWADGAVTTQIKTDGLGPYLEVAVNIPAGSDSSKRNQSFVLNCHVPLGQHGPWDNYGYSGPDNGPVRPNTVYVTGDTLCAYADIDWDFTTGKMHGSRFIVNVLGVDNNNINTTGAYVSGIAFSHNFWPPTELKKMHMPRTVEGMKIKTPKVRVPTYQSGETRRYSQVKLEFAFDDYQEAVVGVMKIRNLAVYKN